MDLKISDLTAGTVTSNDWLAIERSAASNYRLNLQAAIGAYVVAVDNRILRGNGTGATQSSGWAISDNDELTGAISSGVGIYVSANTDSATVGVQGEATGADGTAIRGTASAATSTGVLGEALIASSTGVTASTIAGGTAFKIVNSAGIAANFVFLGTSTDKTISIPDTTGTLLVSGGAGSFTTLSASGTLTLGTTTSQITGANGNMTITAGTGASNTLTFKTTTSGSTATTVMTLNADQSITKGSSGTAALNAKLYNTILSDGNGCFGVAKGDGAVGDGVAFSSSGTGIIISSNQALTWSSTTSVVGSPDLLLYRDASGTLQMGADHATTPTTQTIKAHDVTTGVGSALILAGGKGSSSGGQLILSTSLTSGAAAARLVCSADGTSYFTGKFGYGNGSGSSTTQTESRTDGVTINASSGSITLFSEVGSITPFSITVTNNKVSASDTIILSQKSGTDKYHLLVTAVAAGSFEITAYTTGGTTTESPVINFAVVKGSTS